MLIILFNFCFSYFTQNILNRVLVLFNFVQKYYDKTKE